MQQDITNTQNENDRQTQTEVAQQPKDKNDSIQLSSRYLQYCFAKRHLRGTPRPQVFPFRESNKKDIEQLNSPTHSNDRIYGDNGISPTLNTMQGGRRQPKVLAIKYGQNNPERNGNTDENMFTLKTGGANAGITDGAKIRRLTPTECERLQGFPDGWTEGVSDTQRYKTLGNAVTVNVIRDIMTRLLNTV